MLLVTALALCFGVSLVASMLGYSVALGAFLIGAVMAETRQIHKIEAVTAPVRDMFSAIFFVTIGMLIAPRMLMAYAGPIAIISLVVVVGKVASCSFGVFVGGRDLRTSLCVGMGLAQIGEFSFIIATLGLSLKVTSDFLYPVAVAVSVVTTLVTPYLLRATEPVAAYLDRVVPRPIMQGLAVYTTWIGSFGKSGPGPMVRIVRLMAYQLLVNLLLTVGVFALGAWVLDLDAPHLPPVLRSPELNQSLVWIVVMTLTAPIYLASFRKLTAMSTLVAEICFPMTLGSDRGRCDPGGHQPGLHPRLARGHDLSHHPAQHLDSQLAPQHVPAAAHRHGGDDAFSLHPGAPLQPRRDRAERDAPAPARDRCRGGEGAARIARRRRTGNDRDPRGGRRDPA